MHLCRLIAAVISAVALVTSLTGCASMAGQGSTTALDTANPYSTYYYPNDD